MSKIRVVKSEKERTGKWRDTGVYFEANSASGGKVLCMYERAANLLITVLPETIRNDNPFGLQPEQFYLRLDRIAIGKRSEGCLFDNEEQMLKGKRFITREEFVRAYNYNRLKLIDNTNLMEP